MTSISRSFLLSRFFGFPLGISPTVCLSAARVSRHSSSGSPAIGYVTFPLAATRRRHDFGNCQIHRKCKRKLGPATWRRKGQPERGFTRSPGVNPQPRAYAWAPDVGAFFLESHHTMKSSVRRIRSGFTPCVNFGEMLKAVEKFPLRLTPACHDRPSPVVPPCFASGRFAIFSGNFNPPPHSIAQPPCDPSSVGV